MQFRVTILATAHMPATRKPKPKPKVKRPVGRPSVFSQRILDKIVAALSEGTPLAHVCRQPGMPAARTVSDWIERHPEVSAAIARARDAGEDVIAANLRDVARGNKRKGSTGDVRRDKLIVWTDLQLLSKWNPKKYGDRQQLEHSGPGGGPVETRVTVRFVKPPERPDDDGSAKVAG